MVPSVLIFNDRKLKVLTGICSMGSLVGTYTNRDRHSVSSRDVQAVITISYSWQSHSKTTFQVYGAVWHCKPDIESAAITSLALTNITSSVIRSLHFDSGQRDTGLDSVHLFNSVAGCEAQPVSIQENNHVFSFDTISRLPTNMKNTAELDVSKGSNASLRRSIQILRDISQRPHSLPSFSVPDQGKRDGLEASRSSLARLEPEHHPWRG